MKIIIIFFLSLVIISCEKEIIVEYPPVENTKFEKQEKQNEVFDNKPNTYTQNIKIRFLEFEASSFEVSVISDRTTTICLGFFHADDIDCNGKVKTGKSIIRLQKIPVPNGETVEYYDQSGVELTCSDESKHLIKFILPE